MRSGSGKTTCRYRRPRAGSGTGRTPCHAGEVNSFRSGAVLDRKGGTMPLKSLLLTSVLVAFTAAASAARTSDVRVSERTNWTIDGSRSDVRFTVTKLGFEDVTGIFHESEGTIQYEPDRPERSRIEWRIKVASVTTEATNRDKTLQAPEYFDAARHPYLSFVSQSVRGLSGGRLEVTGQLTMRGVTRPLVTTVNVVNRGPSPSFETAF